MILRALNSHEEFKELEQRAKDEGHYVIAPTQVAEKDGQIVGYTSIMPAMLVWLSRKHVVARDSIELLRGVEHGLSLTGQKHLMVPCAEDSPFYKHLPRLGFVTVGSATINIKPI